MVFVNTCETPFLAPEKCSSEGPTVAILWAETEPLKKDCFAFISGLQLFSKLPPTWQQLSLRPRRVSCLWPSLSWGWHFQFGICGIYEFSENLCQFCISAFFQDRRYSFYQILKASVTWKRLRTPAFGQIPPSEVFLKSILEFDFPWFHTMNPLESGQVCNGVISADCYSSKAQTHSTSLKCKNPD